MDVLECRRVCRNIQQQQVIHRAQPPKMVILITVAINELKRFGNFWINYFTLYVKQNWYRRSYHWIAQVWKPKDSFLVSFYQECIRVNARNCWSYRVMFFKPFYRYTSQGNFDVWNSTIQACSCLSSINRIVIVTRTKVIPCPCVLKIHPFSPFLQIRSVQNNNSVWRK